MYTIHHVALSVTDRQRSIDFYALLGFERVHQWEADDKSLSITHLKLGSFILELFCYASPTPAPSTIHTTSTDLPVIGTKHFGLKVDSIETARDDLAAKGVIAADTQINQGRTGPRYIFVEDPDGILVEISEDKRDFGVALHHRNTDQLTAVVAGCVLERDGKYLLVQEKQPKVYGKWNLPAGRVDKGETIDEAAVREVQEESGFVVELGERLCVSHARIDTPVLHSFSATIVGGELAYPEDELLDARWFTLEEVRGLATKNELRTPWILDSIERAAQQTN